MSTKKTKKEVKPESKEELAIAPEMPNTDIWQQSDEQIKANLFFAATAKEVYRLVFLEGTPITKERLDLAHGLMAMRTYDFQSEVGADAAIARAIRECRETVFTSLIYACVKNGVCMTDTVFVMQALNTEAALLPVWDYNHAEQADEFSMGPPGAKPEKSLPELKKRTKAVFDSLGVKENIDVGAEVDE
jgi:hypothetical protein